MSTEYGVLLMDAVVAPCGNLLQAVTYSRGADREICSRDGYDGEWSIIAPADYASLRVDCLAPNHRTLRRHEAAGEKYCVTCYAFAAWYARQRYRRRKQAAA